MPLETSRDRNGTFDPMTVPKGARRVHSIDQIVLSPYAKGQTVSDIQTHLREIYDIEVSHDLISKIAP